MGEFGAENAKDPLWKAAAEALETMTADVPSGSIAQWEQMGMRDLMKLAEEYGAVTLIEKCIEHNGRDTYLFHWFAYAGIGEIVPYLEPYLDSDDLEEVTDAITGLIYFGHDRAFKEIERFCEGSHHLKLTRPDDPLWWFEHDLERSDTPRARSCLEKLRDWAKKRRDYN